MVGIMELATIGLFVATGVLAVMTGVYVGLTWKILKEQHAMRVDEQRPLLVMRVISEDKAKELTLILIVENVGRGVAVSVKFETDENWSKVFGDLKGEYGGIKDGMRYLPPGVIEKLKGIPLKIVDQAARRAVNESTVIKVTYEDSLHNVYWGRAEIQFDEFISRRKFVAS